MQGAKARVARFEPFKVKKITKAKGHADAKSVEKDWTIEAHREGDWEATKCCKE